MKNTSNQAAYDVIIAGAGPTGLFLACELALAKCTVLVLEKAASPHSSFKQLPFGIRGLNAPSTAALHQRGLLGELELHKRLQNPHQAAGPEGRRQIGHFAGIPLYEDDVDAAQWTHRLPGSPPTSLLTEMQELETVLATRAAALGVVVQRGVAINSFVQTEGGVTVQAGGQTFGSKWLVGCDGSRSVVRKGAGFDFAGTEPEFTGYSVQADLADAEQLRPGRNLTATGMYIQSQPGYLILGEFDGGAFHRAGQPATRAHIEQVLRRVSGTNVTVSALHQASTWTDQARQATTYRAGRVLLAGDAAHIHSPLGGQGLNLGLGDALNLGWKLAATIHGHAPAGLLDSYTTERHPLGVRVLDWSRAQVAIMRPDPAARALNALMRDLLATRDGATYAAGRVRGVFTQYELGGDHPLTGHAVPNFALADGTQVSELLRAGRGLLLDFAGSPALQALAHDYQLPYAAGPAHEQLGLGAVLVRPDGFVAWAAGSEPDLAAARQAAARWFAPTASPSLP